MQRCIGGNLHQHPNFPLWFGVATHADLSRPAVRDVIGEVSALHHASSGDAPACMVYHQPNVRLPDDAFPRDGGHHPAFGVKLKEALDAEGVQTVVVIQGRAVGGDPFGSLVAFMREKLGR